MCFVGWGVWSFGMWWRGGKGRRIWPRYQWVWRGRNPLVNIRSCQEQYWIPGLCWGWDDVEKCQKVLQKAFKIIRLIFAILKIIWFLFLCIYFFKRTIVNAYTVYEHSFIEDFAFCMNEHKNSHLYSDIFRRDVTWHPLLSSKNNIIFELSLVFFCGPVTGWPLSIFICWPAHAKKGLSWGYLLGRFLFFFGRNLEVSS